MNIFFDLETIPAAPETEGLVREQYERRSKYASDYRRPTSYEEYLHGTSLDPNFGQILCIGYAIDDEPVAVLTGDEKSMLKDFWKLAKDANCLTGHNAVAFDVPFLWKRSILQGIEPTLPIDSKADELVYDTMLAWDLAMPKKHTGLDLLAKLLGVPTSKTGMTGAEVYDYYKAGKLDDIYEYCKRDVVATRSVYKKLTFGK